MLKKGKTEKNVVFTTVPSLETAEKIARGVVGEKIAACASILSGVKSVYTWKGEVCEEAEHIIMIKTSSGLLTALEKKIKELHPYELPELIAIPVESGSEEYLKWIEDSLAAKG